MPPGPSLCDDCSIYYFGRLTAEQKLEYQGLELQDNNSLELYQISDNSIIQLSSKILGVIFVKNLRGNLKIYIDLDAPVLYLKEKVKESGGIPVGMKSSLVSGVVVNCVLL